MARTVTEAARELGVFNEADVLVAGGGMAGVAAAVAAARAGARTVLLERNGCLGGVATSSPMASIGNRFMLADGTQVVQGLAGEVVDRLVAHGAASPNWRQHKCIPLDAERLKVVLFDLLDAAGVTVLTHSLACQPLLDGRRVRGVFFESKSGRLALLAGNTVDCTGEADLAHRAGATVHEHRASSTLLFKLANVDLDRFVSFLGEDPEGFPCGDDSVKDYPEFAARWRDDGVLFFPHHGGKRWRWLQRVMADAAYGELHDGRRWWGPADNIEAFGMYAFGRQGTVAINTGYFCFDRIEVGELSRFELLAQRFAYVAADFMTRHIPGFERARVEQIGTDLGLRGGRFIEGRSRLRRADFTGPASDRHCDDVIATGPISSGQPGERAGSLNSTCDIPFGSCVPVGLAGLLVGSGKSVDTEGGNWRINRGMSGCLVYGQACGAAAALASRAGTTADALPIRDLQRELLRQGVRLGAPARLAALGLG